MTLTAQSALKPILRDFGLGLITIALCTGVALPVLAQEAENDGAGPISDMSIDADATSLGDNVPVSQQLRLDPIGSVDGVGRTAVGDPYAPEGIRVGRFIVRPSLEIGLTGTRSVSNVDSGGATGFIEDESYSTSSRNSLGLLINSDWSRHALGLDLNGTLPIGISGDEDDFSLDALANLNLDLSALTSLSLTAQYEYDTDDPQSAAVQAAIDAGAPNLASTNDPATQLYGGEAILRHDFGGLTAQINASIARLEYSAAELSNGTSVSQSDLNSTDYNIALRGGYALSGVLSPFVEVGFGQRITDDDLDAAGFDRNATRYSARVGTEFDYGEKLSGEVSVGYGLEELDDATLSDVSGVTVDAELDWSPWRGTDVSLDASTRFEPSGSDDVSGSILYATELGLSQRITSQLIGTANLGVSHEIFEGPADDETTVNGSLGLIYNLNRYVALTGRIGHEQTFSSDESQRDSSSDVFVGVRLQR